jgi:hypothetical protein
MTQGLFRQQSIGNNLKTLRNGDGGIIDSQTMEVLDIFGLCGYPCIRNPHSAGEFLHSIRQARSDMFAENDHAK